MYLISVEFVGENYGKFPRTYVVDAYYANDAIKKLNKQIKKDLNCKSLDYLIIEMKFLQDAYIAK